MSLIAQHIFEKLQMGCTRVYQDYPLAKLTTFGIGGPADIMAMPSTMDELQALLRVAADAQLPYFIFGGGSNLLVSDSGIRGVVIKLTGDFTRISVSEDNKRIEVGAGATFPMLTAAALQAGWQNALGWYGTPGTAGGALRMNAGTTLGEIGDVIDTIEGIDSETTEVFSKSSLVVSYRNIKFPRPIIITRAWLENSERFSNPAELLEKARDLRQKRKMSQPKLRCAGSIFKNPAGDYAGRLIESAGFKGKKSGGAEISPVHANFIVNNGGATAKNVYELALSARKEVYAKYRILLEFEVQFAGDMEFLH